MKIRRVFFAAALSFFILTGFVKVRAEELNLDAPSYILVEAKTGQVILEKNSNVQMYPASTTKILTGILALEMGDPDKLMTASKAAVLDIGKDGMNIGIMAGEEMKMRDLVNVMLIRSANETANILAENLAPTRNDFIALMNKKAVELGATHSKFVNTNGMHDNDHYTTAADIAKIACYAMKNPTFREIVAKKEYSALEPTNKHTSWPVLASTNKLLLYNKYKSELYTQITGIKTGSTGQAGNNLVSSAISKDGLELISVILGVKSPVTDSVFASSKSLLEYGFSNYSKQEVIQKDLVYKTLTVEDAKDVPELNLLTESSFSYLLPNDKNSWNINIKEFIAPVVQAPVKQGDVLGYLEYERNGQVIGKVNLLAANDVEKKATAIIAEKVQQTVSKPSIILYAVPVILLCLIYIYLRVILRKKIRRVKYYK